jgi:hypothetical protein
MTKHESSCPMARKPRSPLVIAALIATLSLAQAFAEGPKAKEPAASAPTTGKAVPAKIAPSKTDADKTDAAKPADIPDAYREISLGMDIDAVKEALQKDAIFGYRGERDVSLLQGENRSLIETSGLSFIKRSWLQFSDGKLYIMIFSLDPDLVDYYSMYSSLVAKYGEPVSLDPRKAVWANDKVSLSLERPLTVKYIDLTTFNALLDKSGTEKAASDIRREEFINGF